MNYLAPWPEREIALTFVRAFPISGWAISSAFLPLSYPGMGLVCKRATQDTAGTAVAQPAPQNRITLLPCSIHREQEGRLALPVRGQPCHESRRICRDLEAASAADPKRTFRSDTGPTRAGPLGPDQALQREPLGSRPRENNIYSLGTRIPLSVR